MSQNKANENEGAVVDTEAKVLENGNVVETVEKEAKTMEEKKSNIFTKALDGIKTVTGKVKEGWKTHGKVIAGTVAGTLAVIGGVLYVLVKHADGSESYEPYEPVEALPDEDYAEYDNPSYEAEEETDTATEEPVAE